MPKETQMLKESLRQKLLEIARRSMEGHLKEGKVPTFLVTEPELQEQRALRVRSGRLDLH